MQIVRSRTAARLLVAVIVVAGPFIWPADSAATPSQDAPGADAPGQTASGGQGVGEDDVLRASGTSATDLAASLDGASADVRAEVDAVIAARAAEEKAASELVAADEAVAQTEARIDELTDVSDEVVVDAFMNPPSESAMETLASASLSDATVRQSILTSQANENAELLSALEAAQDDLTRQRRRRQDAAAAASAQAAEAEAALADLVAVQSHETRFVLAVQDRLAATLAEADALERIDPEAAAALRAREGELAGKIDQLIADRERRAAEEALAQAMAEAAARAEREAAEADAAAAAAASSGSGGASLGPATGSLSSVACPGGGSITVDGSLGASLQAMLDAAAADGYQLCGGGYRDPSEQIALRRANCGTSDYAIYEAPSSSCSPPTARPGTSNHELGLAIDFTCGGGGTLSSSSGCFAWLVDNAATYGLYNLPSEAWHWSTDGT
jgi:peptidoglycan hydrolase CwlO-like protein